MYSRVEFSCIHKPVGCPVLHSAHERNWLSYVDITNMADRLRHDACLFIVPFRTTLFSETSKRAIGLKQHTETFLLTLACRSALFLLLLYCLIITCNTDEEV